MSRATAPLRHFASRLAADEAQRNKHSRRRNPGALGLCEPLRPGLAALMGTSGFRSLLARALALASGEHAWLRTVAVKSDGSLDGGGNVGTKVAAAAIAEGESLLLAELLGLLVAFIGEALTLQLVREAWPKRPLSDLDFSQRTAK